MEKQENEKNGKKTLLIATDNFLPRWDGIARFLSHIIPYLMKDFNIKVIAPSFPKHAHKEKETEDRFRGVEIIRLSPSNLKGWGDYVPAKLSIKKIKEQVKQSDIVWIQATGPIGFPAIKAARKYKKPCVAFVHSLEWVLAKNSMYRWNFLRNIVFILGKLWVRHLYNRCDLLIVPSQEVKEIMGYHGITTEKNVVTLGVSIHHFKPAEDKKEAKKDIKIDPHDRIVGYCGRIGREKDLVTLYKAFKRLSKRTKNVKLLVVGEGVTDHERVLVPKDKVIEVGAKDNVLPYLQAMDIYVLPSLTETSSLSTMEAMACGCAVASTKVGDPANYIKNKVNGLFFPKGNDLVLSMKIKQLLDDPILRDVLGKNARKTIVEDYNWERTPAKIVNILRKFNK